MFLKVPAIGTGKFAKLIVGAVVVCIAAGSAFVAITVLGVNAAFPNWEGADWIRGEAGRIAIGSPANRVALSVLAGHPVTIACWLGEYVELLPVAERNGLPIADIPDVQVRENSFGLLMADAETVTYGEFDLQDVDQDAAYAAGCITGADLALAFDGVEPLTGGRVVDLGGHAAAVD